MGDTSTVSWGVAGLAGMLSFLSPCVLPLMPAYLTLISGASLAELQAGPSSHVRRRVMLNAVAFVLGFSCVFIGLGATATFAGRLLADLRFEIFGLPIGLAQIGGLVVVIMGLHVAGWLPIRALYRVWNLKLPARDISLVGSFAVGAGFAFGWTPCVGPILGSILALAASSETLTSGLTLLLAYSVGLAIPFLLSGWSIEFLLRLASGMKVHFHALEVGSGILLIGVGGLVMTGYWAALNGLALDSFSGLTERVLDLEDWLLR
jgi:cytochrome c-type biogenesis protein